jgi:hypothetical protein
VQKCPNQHNEPDQPGNRHRHFGLAQSALASYFGYCQSGVSGRSLLTPFDRLIVVAQSKFAFCDDAIFHCRRRGDAQLMAVHAAFPEKLAGFQYTDHHKSAISSFMKFL